MSDEHEFKDKKGGINGLIGKRPKRTKRPTNDMAKE